jgi:hypothetical protein
MGDDQMVLGVYGRLYVVADHAGATAARRHRARIRIRQRDLLVGCLAHHRVQTLEPRHLLFQPLDLLLEPRRLGQDRI